MLFLQDRDNKLKRIINKDEDVDVARQKILHESSKLEESIRTRSTLVRKVKISLGPSARHSLYLKSNPPSASRVEAYGAASAYQPHQPES
jgi:uncharacterized protein (DUF2062 family)